MRAAVALLLLLASSTPSVASAQIFASRNMVFTPLDDTTGSSHFLGNTGFVGEVNRGFGSEGESQAWNVKAGGFIELYRWGSIASLAVMSMQEFSANVHNEVGFNPKGLISEEALTYVRRAGGFQLGLSAFIRCRHDIDNAEGPNEYQRPHDLQIEQRVLVVRGLQATVVSDPVPLSRSARFRVLLRTDYNLSFNDWRATNNVYQTSPHEAIGAVQLGGHVDLRFSKGWSGYTRGWMQAFRYTEPKMALEINSRLEAGMLGHGPKGTFSVFSAWERFFDDFSKATPQSSHAVGFGIRMNSRLLF